MESKMLKLLKASFYKINPPDGKVVYMHENSLTPIEAPLVKSSDIDHTIPYEYLNPLQSLFHMFYKNGSALIFAPTSAGKSLIAYLFMMNKNGRKVYVAPTKSLIYEKTIELKRYYGSNVDMRTGDNVLENQKPITKDVVVTTYENLVLSFRNGADWINDISAVVFDEVHQLLSNWAVEEAIAYVVDKGIDLLGLSATLPSYEEIASKIRASLVIQSEWRPVPLERQAHHLNALTEGIKFRTKDKTDREELIARKLLHIIFDPKYKEEQLIVFVPRKILGWKLLEVANDESIGFMNKTVPFEITKEREPEIAFHNADVPKEEKDEIERAFRNGTLKKLIATQTLAYGVNLPADRVMIFTRSIYDKIEKRKVIIPDPLDIIQMEGRTGRLGIRDIGYSNIIVHGDSVDNIIASLANAFSVSIREIKRNIREDKLSIIILLAVHYKGKDYMSFLQNLISYKAIPRYIIDKIIYFLESHQYISNFKVTEKGLYCIKSGIPPHNLETFFKRLRLEMDTMAVVRPLLHMKVFGNLVTFLKDENALMPYTERIEAVISVDFDGCVLDNTHQFLYYIHGATFDFPNVTNPPGEFSYLGNDSLYLIRTLMDLQKMGMWVLSDLEIVKIASAVKFGIEPHYASLSGIKGIGHIRCNLLKRVLQRRPEFSIEIGDTVGKIFDIIPEQDLRIEMFEVLTEQRRLEPSAAETEVSKVINILKRNSKGKLIDDKILLAYNMFKYGNRAYRFKREDMLRNLLTNSKVRG